MIDKFWGLLNKGSEEAAEQGFDVLRIRGVCIVQFFLFPVIAFLLRGQGTERYVILMLLGSLFMALNLLATYRLMRERSFMLFIICMVAMTIVPSIGLGFSLGFQNLIYVALLLTLLDPHIVLQQKFIYCVAGILVPLVLDLIDRQEREFAIEQGSVVSMEILMVNEMFFVINIIVIGLSFARHQVEAERQLALANQRLKLAADTDQLTQLPNRRAILSVLEDIEGGNESVTIGMGDIDHFKVVNDTYGHEAGDEVLKRVAQELLDFMEGKGHCARWGGEEFLLVFIGMNGDECFLALDDFRRRLAEMETDYDGLKIRVTMTFGLEEHGYYLSAQKTIKQADVKLYTGKQSGRNKVVY